VTINIVQIGGDVDATLSGSLTGPESGSSFVGSSDFIQPDAATIEFGPTAISDAPYFYLYGPGSWGPGSATSPTSSSGDFALFLGGTNFYVPIGYVAGSPLAATDTFAGQTLASMGLTQGTYAYSLVDSSGAQVDTVTVNIDVFTGGVTIGGTGGSTGGVPEPATWGMMLLGFGAIGLVMRRQRVGAAFKSV
jgi:hypothetical protein